MQNRCTYNYQPIILIGAGRSGTKVIRDVIGTHPDIDIVPFDVNYIWKIGQQQDHDELLPQDLSDKMRCRIISQFSKQIGKAPILLEKTVSNCLRIPYVLKVFPDAKLIHLTRDGRDVVESVMRQWGEVREVSYFFKKLKTFPIRYAFSYLMDYITNWIKLGLGKQATEDYIWGVRYPGYQEDLRSKSTLEICAIQWRSCVEASLQQLGKLDKSQWMQIRYEDLMSDPKQSLEKIGQFISVDTQQFDISRIRPTYVGRHKKVFDEAQMEKLMNIIRPSLEKLNYG